jgi:hypothetical protein
VVANAHLWDFSTPVSPVSMLRHTVQIIAGNGGSKEDPIWEAAGNSFYYGFTLVQVLKNGEVVMKSLRPRFRSDQLPGAVAAGNVSHDDSPDAGVSTRSVVARVRPGLYNGNRSANLRDAVKDSRP